MEWDIGHLQSGVHKWWRTHRDAVRTRTAAWGMQGAYGVLVASTFAPLLQIVSPADLPAVLVGIAGATGGNLLANLIQASKDDAVEALIEASQRADVREAVDVVVAAGKSVDMSSVQLGDDWEDFADDLEARLQDLGGSPHVREQLDRVRIVRQNRAGRDVIAPESGGTVIRHGDSIKYGLSPEDIAGLLEAWARLLQDPAARVEGSSERGSVDATSGPDRVTVTHRVASQAPTSRGPAAWLAMKTLDEAFAGLDDQFIPLAGAERIKAQLAWLEPDRGTGMTKQHHLADVREACDKFPRFLLTGEPGGGKSFVLQKLALERFQAAVREPDRAVIPFLVELGSHRGGSPAEFLFHQWAEQGYERGLGLPLDAVLEAGRLLLLADGLNEMPRDQLRRLPRAWGEWLGRTTDFPPGNRAVFSCRSNDVAHADQLNLPRVEVLPLTLPQVAEFIEHRLEVDLAARLVKKIEEDDRSCRAAGKSERSLLTLAGNPFMLQVMTEIFETRDDLPANRGELMRHFSDCLLTREARRRDLLSGDAEAHLGLLQEWHDRMAPLAYAMQAKGLGTRFPRQAVLAAIAEDRDQDGLIDLMIGARIMDLVRTSSAGTIYHFKHHLLQESFAAHALLQRFLAGDSLGDLWRVPRLKNEMPDADARSGSRARPAEPETDEDSHDWRPLPPPPGSGWEETTILAAGLAVLRDAPQAHDPCFVPLMRAVRAANPALAARCFDEADRDLLSLAPGDLVDAIRSDLLADLRDPQVHLRARLDSGLRLGRIGDPRFKPERPRGGPNFVPMELCHVPGGSYLVGNPDNQRDPRHDRDAYADEQHGAEVDLPEFWIGKYPVTNAEYRCFWSAGGYDEEQWWDETGWRWRGGEIEVNAEVWLSYQRWAKDLSDGWRQELADSREWRPEELETIAFLRESSEEDVIDSLNATFARQRRDQPLFWDDPAYTDWVGANQPVIGVCWHEARAYCRWVNARWRAVADETMGAVPDNYVARLPSETEWEAAARGPAALRFPWGGEFDSDKANTIVGRVLRVSPVGAYPAGESFCGALDMSGNVWEWTLSLWGRSTDRPEFSYPYVRDDGREDENTGNNVLRVGRGGSWIGPARLARCAYRSRAVPVFRDNAVGFRVAVAPPTSSR